MATVDSIGVVGGGLAGLAAAWRLVAAGYPVDLYERRSVTGGRMRSDTVDGVRFDPGVQLLGSNYEEVFRLAGQAGASQVLRRSPGKDALWRNGRAHPLVYGSIPSMVASSALPAGLKLKLGMRYLPFLLRDASGLDVNELVRSGGAKFDQESIAAWGERVLGSDFVELLVYPMLAAYYGATPEQTSAALYHAQARVGLDVSVCGSVGGMGELPALIAKALMEEGVRIHFDCIVEGVRSDGKAAEVLIGGSTRRHSAVVVATPAAVAHELIDQAAMCEWLAEVRAAPTATLTLICDRAVEADYFGVSFPRTERLGADVAAVCVQDRKLAEGGLGPALVVLPSPQAARELVSEDADSAVRRLLPAVEAAFPHVRASIKRARLTAFPEGYTVFQPGHIGHLARYPASTLPAPLALAGDYLSGPTVEGAVRSGFAAADRILAFSSRV